MLIDTVYLGSRLILGTVLKRAVSKPIPLLTAIKMESKDAKIRKLKSLFDQLQNAKKSVDCLKQELNNIKAELEAIEDWPLFGPCLIYSHSSAPDISPSLPDPNDYRVRITFGDGPAPKRAKLEFPEQDGYVVVYTDGACENNGGDNAKAGIGVWFGNNHPHNVSKPVVGKATNNAAEIQACIAAVKIAKENDIKKLKIITDSQFTINAMTKWIEGWKKKGWKLAGGKGDVKNKADFQKLDSLCEGLDIQWEHVSGHSGIEGNEKADKLAREGAKLYKPDP